jgi:GGDEF domain-containing protein
MTNKDIIIAKLEEKLHRVSWNDKFGCYNRQGFEHLIWPDIAPTARFIVFFDVDHLHELNESFGSQAPVDAKIKQVLSIVRSTDYVAGQWKSGDEFLVCITESNRREVLDPEGLKQRLVNELKQQDMSATFVIVEVKSWDLAENVDPAEEKMYELKKQRGITR